MHTRALQRVGESGLHFVTDGLSLEVLRQLSVTPHLASKGDVGQVVQSLVGEWVAQGVSLAAFPEGPYCVPLSTLE
jgi:hypothetical protein